MNYIKKRKLKVWKDKNTIMTKEQKIFLKIKKARTFVLKKPKSAKNIPMAQGKVVVPYNKTPKSYIIKDKEGNVHRRNRRQIFIDKSNKKFVSNNL